MKAQIKAARDLIGMTQQDLCEAAGVPLITLRRIEGKPDHTGLVAAETVARVKEALEAQGVQFLEAGQLAAGPGVAVKVAL